MRLDILIKRLPSHSYHCDQSAVPILSEQHPKIGLKDLQVKIKSNWAEAGRL